MAKNQLIAGVCAAAIATGAAAQEPANTRDQIVVTAQKREQSILDVGLTVTALGADTLRDSRVLEMRELATYVSNVDIREQAPGLLPIITIRGVGLNDFSNTNNPSAGIYVDEVYLSSLGLMAFDFYDLERVEVLKGPQGTLYGRNSTAGAINFISAKPHFDGAEAMLSSSYGKFSTLEVEAMANLPVSDTLAIRLSAKTIQQWKGYYFNRTIDDDVGERNVALGRAQVRWRPNDRADINFKLDAFTANSNIGIGSFFGGRDFTNPPTNQCAALAQGMTDPACSTKGEGGDTSRSALVVRRSTGPSRIVRPPVLNCRGTKPTQAAKSRPRSNASPLPTAATIAVEIIGPMPGIVMMLAQFSSVRLIPSISSETSSIRLSSQSQSP